MNRLDTLPLEIQNMIYKHLFSDTVLPLIKRRARKYEINEAYGDAGAVDHRKKFGWRSWGRHVAYLRARKLMEERASELAEKILKMTKTLEYFYPGNWQTVGARAERVIDSLTEIVSNPSDVPVAKLQDKVLGDSDTDSDLEYVSEPEEVDSEDDNEGVKVYPKFMLQKSD